MSGSGAPRRAGRRAGFTLIELMAVVAILVLIGGIVLPRLSMAASQAALDEGRGLAATLDYARERAIAERRAHRVVFDFEGQRYWIEARRAPPRAEARLAWGDLDELPLVAERAEGLDYEALPTALGRPRLLREHVRFEALESDAGDVHEGLAAIAFAPDGGTAAARLALLAGDDTRVWIRVGAFADVTRVSFDAPP